MTRVVFVGAGGAVYAHEAPTGDSVMRTAVRTGVPGILAECGGACACATCHVYVASEWAMRLDPPSPIEAEMLDCVIDRRQNSRLSCQIAMTPALAGLTVHVPDAQK